MRYLRAGLLLLSLALPTACGGTSEPAETTFNEPEAHPALSIPELAHSKAPETFRVRIETTKGAVLVEVERAGAPNGADRFYNLVDIGFFTGVAFFRVVPGFIAQFGIHGDPQVNKVWSSAVIKDDPTSESNLRGTLSFAQAGSNSRSTQLFFNLKDNTELDQSGFVPIGRAVEGMEVLDSIYAGYGELYPKGRGPRPQLLNLQGNSYLSLHFPEMDYVESATVESIGE